MGKRNERNGRNKKIKLVIRDIRAFVRSTSILLLIITMCLCFIFARKVVEKYFIKPASSDEIVSEEGPQKDSKDKEVAEDAKFTMAVTGDIMCHNTQYADAKSGNTYDFSYVFEDIKKYIQTADIAVGNLETTFTGSAAGYSGYPTFNTPEALAYNLKDLGFDVLTTSNNHSLDKGYKGIESTIKFLDDADISHTGTFTSEESQNTILYKYVKGVKIAFLSYTYGTNGIPIPSGKEYCINLIDKDLIKKHIELAKKESPDLICVSMHWGVEYRTTPTDEQKELADFLFKNCADVIIGNHSHVLEPMEKRTIALEDGTTKDGFVIYSLGNFISGQVKEYTRDTAILNIKITKNGETGKITIDDASYVPLYMYKGTTSTKAYKLLDINSCISAYEAGAQGSISTSLYKTLVAELTKIKKILGE